MKAKNEQGVEIICSKCNKSQTVNECQLHKSNTRCYYCHLMEQHIVENKEMTQNG